MAHSVRYYIKHSGQFLYKISNEESLGDSFKITKILLPDVLKAKGDPKLESEVVGDDAAQLVTKSKKGILSDKSLL